MPMSDMSLPPLSLVPLGTEAQPHGGPPAAETAPTATYAWPVPPMPGYPAPLPITEPEPCELEGPNGKVSRGRLVVFDPLAAHVQVNIPPARGILPLKLTQFRRLTLTRPLSPLPAMSDDEFDATTPLLPQNLLQPCRLRFKNGDEVTVDTLGLIETPPGLFTFTPMDVDGRVLRNFFPRAL
ncbi:MAG: pilus assembly protein PilB, partial [Burkholderiales bacterium PBB5]